MINLLPDEVKRDIRAARMNVLLLKYNLYTFVFLLMLIGISAMFFVFLNFTQSSAVQTSTKNQEKSVKLLDVQKEADQYKNNLAMAKKILDESINYTDVILSITELVPSGVVLDFINLKPEDFGTPLQFAAHATSFDKASQLKDNFQNSEIFSNVFIQNLADAGNSGSSEGSSEQGSYPIGFTLSAQLNKVATVW